VSLRGGRERAPVFLVAGFKKKKTKGGSAQHRVIFSAPGKLRLALTPGKNSPISPARSAPATGAPASANACTQRTGGATTPRHTAGFRRGAVCQSTTDAGTGGNTGGFRCSPPQALTVGVGRSGLPALRRVRRGAGVLKEGARPLQHQLRSENGCSRAGMVRMLVRSWIAHDVSARANLQRPAWCL